MHYYLPVRQCTSIWTWFLYIWRSPIDTGFRVLGHSFSTFR